MTKRISTSDSIPLTLLLACSGGLMDAYSYLARGQVFANAQTGNILLFSIHLTEGQLSKAFSYLFPILSFALGVALAALARIHYRNRPHVHWRQLIVLLEALLFFAVPWIPSTHHPIANSLISLACGAQVESFRKVETAGAATGIATTMCIGNLRLAVQSLCDYFGTKEPKALKQALHALLVILGFSLGAIVCGHFLLPLWEEKAILGSGLIMCIAFVIMLRKQAFDPPDPDAASKYPS